MNHLGFLVALAATCASAQEIRDGADTAWRATVHAIAAWMLKRPFPKEID